MIVELLWHTTNRCLEKFRGNGLVVGKIQVLRAMVRLLQILMGKPSEWSPKVGNYVIN